MNHIPPIGPPKFPTQKNRKTPITIAQPRLLLSTLKKPGKSFSNSNPRLIPKVPSGKSPQTLVRPLKYSKSPSKPNISSSHPLPPLSDPNFSINLEYKLEICKRIYTFYPNEKISSKQQEKLWALQEIHFFFSSPEAARIPIESLNAIIDMLKYNILQSIQISDVRYLYAEEPIYKQSSKWPHLQIIYEILILISKSIASSPTNFLDFARSILPAVSSSDPIERTQLFSYYTHFSSIGSNKDHLNKLIEYFIKIVKGHLASNQNPFGVEFAINYFVYVFNAFANRPPSLNKVFTQCVLPLIQNQFFFFFSTPLLDLISLFAKDNKKNVTMLFLKMIRCWPIQSTFHQNVFLELFDNHYDLLDFKENDSFLPKFIQLLIECSHSESEKIALYCITLWTKHGIEEYIFDNSQILTNVLFTLKSVSNFHWSTSVRESAGFIFEKFRKCLDDQTIKSLTKPTQDIKTENTKQHWKTILKGAIYNDSSFLTDESTVIKNIQKEFQLE